MQLLLFGNSSNTMVTLLLTMMTYWIKKQNNTIETEWMIEESNTQDISSSSKQLPSRKAAATPEPPLHNNEWDGVVIAGRL